MARGKKITLFLMDDDPSGRIKCSLANWTGVAYKIPKTMLDQSKDIPALKQSGVYFLFGADNNGEEVVYIGQAGVRKNGEGLLFRIQEPHNSIDWSEAVMFTTTNNSFGPTEISYLENRFCNLAKSAGRLKVVNSVEPNIGNPTEETVSELEEFIDYAKICMGSMTTFGNKVLEPLVSSKAGNNEPVLTMSYNSAKATGKRTNDGFVVLKGSVICGELARACPNHAKADRMKYASSIDENNTLITDLLFSSPSGAAQFVAGASVSGNVMWKDLNGKTLKEIDAQTEK